MLEEKNDNLLPDEIVTDGNQSLSEEQKSKVLPEEVNAEKILVPDTEVEALIHTENEDKVNGESEIISGETITNDEKQSENVIELTDEQVNNDSFQFENEADLVMNAISNANAEESEDETLKARHDIPMEDYETLSIEQLVEKLETLVQVEKVVSVKENVEELKKSFLSKYHHYMDEKKDEFLAAQQNESSKEDFHYHLPLKAVFDNLYNKYKTKLNAHYKAIQSNLEENLKTRLALVEELKNLVSNPSSSITQSLKQLNDIRDRWKNAGAIPKDKYNVVWNNYHFHMENFYDFLHLDREARDLDFKHNLEQKQRIISRVEELLKEDDINKSFRELQDLHRIWKEEIGPVSREDREEIWNKFSDLTKQMHDKREAYYDTFREKEKENLAAKKEIIAKINELSQENPSNHSGWQALMDKVEALRNTFFATGKVPNEVNEQTWAEFKTAVRAFNVHKNSFYKEIKKDQNDNLSKKQALVAKANELKVSEDFTATTPLMKQIQEEWKTIGHVPRKFSDQLWKEFREACNFYFDRLKDSKKEEDAVEVASFEKKKDYLESLKSFELTGEHKTDLDAIKAHIENWKSLGKVPFNRRHIEGKFNKILDKLFEKLSSSKKESEMMRFANKIDQLGDDTRKLDNEKLFVMRKIEEIQSELFQLENNIQFFANAKADNPMVKEVKKNIERHKEDLVIWKDKLKKLRNINKDS